VTSLAVTPLARASAPVIDRAQASRVLLVALCIIAALCARLSYLARPFDSDGSMFIYMGKLISEGGRFGHQLIDNKFPSVGLMTSVAWRAFGPNWWCYVALETILSMLACAMIARAARRHFGERAMLPAMVFSLVYLNLAPAVFGGFQLETVQSFFVVISAAAALEALESRNARDAFLVGLAAGCAAMLKPTGIGEVIAFLIASARRPFRVLVWQLISACVGIALPAAVVLIYLLAANNLRDMPALARQISRYASSSAWDAADWLKPLTVAIIVGFPFVVRGWIFRNDRLDRPAARRAWSFLIIWFALEAAGVLAQRRMYAYHFLVLAAPASFLFAALPRRDRVSPLLAALAPAMLLSFVGTWTVIDAAREHPARLEASDYLATRASVGEIVWRDDAPRLLLETNLRSGSRHVLMFIFANWDSAPLEYMSRLLADFECTRPRYLVLPEDVPLHAERMGRNIRELIQFPQRRANYSEAWRRIEAYAEEHYVKEATVGDEAVWRRR
jgi:hypothetical protein